MFRRRNRDKRKDWRNQSPGDNVGTEAKTRIKLNKQLMVQSFRIKLTAVIAVIVLLGCFIVAWKHTKNQNKLFDLRLPQKDSDDEMNVMDFSGGHNVDRAYRLGDVFVLWYLNFMSWDHLFHIYTKRYPNTVANRYLVETGEPKFAYRNLTALLRVLDQKEKEVHFRKAGEDELVVHLRLGDVLTDPEYADLGIPIKELWNQEEGFVNFDANVKSNYNKAEFEQLVQRIPREAAEKIKKCVIVGAGFISLEKNGHRNEEYKELVTSFLQETMECDISYYSSTNPDKDLMYMASAHWFIAAMGGFAQLTAACVTARQGWGHAIYDKFNGEVAGNDEARLPKRAQEIFRKEYVDWSRHNTRHTQDF